MRASDGQEFLLRLLRYDKPLADALTGAAWSELLKTSPVDLHPFLAYRLHDLDGVPDPVRGRLETARRAASVGYLSRQAVLRHMAQALDAAGIPFVVLKGVALAHLAYPDPALRPMSDIDLWTRPEDLDATTRVLIEAGLACPERLVSRTAAAARIDGLSTRTLESRGTPVVVEVHGTLKSMAAVAPGWQKEAWARTVESNLGGVLARTLNPEDMLTHLAVHSAAHHRFEGGLRYLLDITLWLQRTGAGYDWPTMSARWERAGCRTWVELVLVLAEELLGAPVPTAVVQRAGRPREFDELVTLARGQVLQSTATLPPTLAKLAATPSFAAGAGWIVHRLTRWYWTGPEGSTRTPLEAAREAARRMGHDLRYKFPPYLHGVWDGSLRGPEWRRRRALAQSRERMGALVAQAERGSRASVSEPA